MATSKDLNSPATHAADSHDLIRVHGARVNNLKDIHVEIPKRRLTAFTGVSGSGKSSLVFGTIAAESQRMINETYSAFLQGFMPTLTRPDVDRLEGLTTAIIVDQERMGANPRSTVGTATDANAMLRILFSRLGKPYVGPQTAFSFNVPTRRASGVMSTDKGGRVERSVVKDAVYLGGMDGWYGRLFEGVGLPMDKPISKFTKKQLDTMLYAEPTKIKVEGINLTFDGIIPKIQKSMLSKDPEAMQPHVRRFVERAVTFQLCPECNGTRLTKEALSSKINGSNIAELCQLQISDLADWVRALNEPSVAPLIAGLQHLLDSFAEIGLGYLSLDRSAGSLSGGEAQRTKMIRATPCWSWSTSPRRSPSQTTSSISDRGRAPQEARSPTREAWMGCGGATPPPDTTSTTGRSSRRRCGRRQGRCRFAVPPRTISGTSTSTFRSACCAS